MARRRIEMLALTLALVPGCTIVTRSGGGAEMPEQHAQAEPTHPNRHHDPAEPAEPVATVPNEPTTPPARDDVPRTPERPPGKPPTASPNPRNEPTPKPPTATAGKPTPPEPKPTTTPSKTPPEPKPPTPTTSKPTPPEPKPPTPTTSKPTPPDPKPTPGTTPSKPPKPKPEPAQPTGIAGFAFGKPRDLQQGLPDAYWVFQDAQGWHLRTTTDNPAVRKFTGRLSLSEGSFSEVKAAVIEKADHVKSTATVVDFDFETIGQMDGVDFKFAGARCLELKLLVDGKAQPKLINVGANKVKPPTAEFLICP